MATVIETTIPTDRFVLEETVTAVPDVEFEFARFAIQNAVCTMPFLWGATSQPDRLDAALENDTATEQVRCLSREDNRGLYSVDWTEAAACRITGFADTDGSVLAVTGTADGWTIKTLCPDRTAAAETFETWREDGVNPSLSRIGNVSCEKETTMGLSSTQYSTIAQAFQTDYYSVPRGTTLSELATDLEISHQALSERLRRGHAHLAEQLLSGVSPGLEQ